MEGRESAVKAHWKMHVVEAGSAHGAKRRSCMRCTTAHMGPQNEHSTWDQRTSTAHGIRGRAQHMG
eukprot:356082-Chlamydomonas_euryale.AAC.8